MPSHKETCHYGLTARPRSTMHSQVQRAQTAVARLAMAPEAVSTP